MALLDQITNKSIKNQILLIGTRQLLHRLPVDMSLSHLGENLRPTVSASRGETRALMGWGDGGGGVNIHI